MVSIIYVSYVNCMKYLKYGCDSFVRSSFIYSLHHLLIKSTKLNNSLLTYHGKLPVQVRVTNALIKLHKILLGNKMNGIV